MAKDNPCWFCHVLTVNETKAIQPGFIEGERKSGMSEEMIQQEFYCSFESALPCAYFAREMREATEQGRIGGIPYDKAVNVNTARDIGIDDSMAIWFYQNVHREIHLIDYYENNSIGLDHFVKLITEKPYIYGSHILPHDARARSAQTGKTFEQYLHDLGIKNTIIAKRPQEKEDAIEAARRLLSTCYFDLKCQRGIGSLRSYRKEYDEKNQTYHVRPVHDWASHGADAFQTLALGHTFQVGGLSGWQPLRRAISSARMYRR
jgi:hypothetical protein